MKTQIMKLYSSTGEYQIIRNTAQQNQFELYNTRGEWKETPEGFGTWKRSKHLLTRYADLASCLSHLNALHLTF